MHHRCPARHALVSRAIADIRSVRTTPHLAPVIPLPCAPRREPPHGHRRALVAGITALVSLGAAGTAAWVLDGDTPPAVVEDADTPSLRPDEAERWEDDAVLAAVGPSGNDTLDLVASAMPTVSGHLGRLVIDDSSQPVRQARRRTTGEDPRPEPTDPTPAPADDAPPAVEPEDPPAPQPKPKPEPEPPGNGGGASCPAVERATAVLPDAACGTPVSRPPAPPGASTPTASTWPPGQPH